jgi:NAD(P)-dependent dehydrogenase (short-subunit alcohol dehydrogenase family)
MEIKNSVALVTGANRGLRKAFTEALLKARATRVYAGARHPGLITLSDSRVVPVSLDVTQEIAFLRRRKTART